jgi:hypothetical protein
MTKVEYSTYNIEIKYINKFKHMGIRNLDRVQ